MSNAMSRSKSRWKGALLATIAGAVVSPMAAQATMTVGVFLNPIGAPVLNGSGVLTNPQTNIYLTPDQNGSAIPLYVYAIVTGSGNIQPNSGSTTGVPGANTSTGSNVFAGVQYAYYNLLASGGNASGLTGGITATTLNSTLGFDSNQNNDGGSLNTSGGVAAQAGYVNLAPGSTLAASTTTVAVGAPSALGATSPVSSSAMTQFAKPRAGSPVWSNYQSYNNSTGNYDYANDGKNIIIGTGSNGLAANQAAFLLETIQYTPSSFNASTPGNLVQTTFSINTPYNGSTSILNNSTYVPANSFNDSSQSFSTYSSTSGSTLATLANSNYSAGHSVTITDTLPGDANGDGRIDGSDLQVVLVDFNKAYTSWSQGNFDGDATIDGGDLQDILVYFNKNVGSVPSTMVADSALLADPQAVALLEAHGITPVAASAVPEPASLGLLAVAASGLMLGRRRRARLV